MESDSINLLKFVELNSIYFDKFMEFVISMGKKQSDIKSEDWPTSPR